MFISANRVQLQDKADHSTSSDEYSIYWRGFVYLDGVAAGTQSMKKFAADVSLEGICRPSERLKGVYSVVVHDHRSGDVYVFVDSSGLFQAFYSERFVSTSFLELVDAEQLRISDLDPEALVEFFHFGNVYWGKTLFLQIKKIAPNQIIRVSRDGILSLLPRAVPELS